MKSGKIIIALLCVLCCSDLQAQNVIKASIDSTQILIGEQTKIRLEIAVNRNTLIQLPIPKDSMIMEGIEVLETSKIDTLDIGNNRIQLKYDFLVTSFDSALYAIPPFELISGGDTAYSNELALKVITVPVDTVSGKFYDIKGVMAPKFVIWDYLSYILIPVLLALLIGLIIYIVYRLRAKKSLIPFRKPEIKLPPHVIALQELNEIKVQKLWQQGKIKEYHSEITDTLRKYLERRFIIPAMELTSGEILGKLKGLSDADFVYDNLKQVLILSDFVKFAKYQSLPDENELSMMNACLFVNGTKIEEKLPAEGEKNESNEKTKNEL